MEVRNSCKEVFTAVKRKCLPLDNYLCIYLFIYFCVYIYIYYFFYFCLLKNKCIFSVCVFLTTHICGWPSVAVAGPLESLSDFAVYLTVDFDHVVCVWSVS